MVVAYGGGGERECKRERIDVEAACVGKYCKQEMGSSVDGSVGGVRSLLTVVTGRAVAVGCLWDRNAKRRY